ncbi:MAG: zinc finger domain-containing protein [Actinopolymorphaceae bacterium]
MSHDELLDTGVVDWIWDGQLKAMFNYTDADLAILARLLLRPCPTCHAGSGQWCHTASGNDIVGLDVQHLARRSLGPS